jgi:hypothetical protein
VFTFVEALDIKNFGDFWSLDYVDKEPGNPAQDINSYAYFLRSYSVPMDAGTAMSVKKRLALLVLGYLAPPYNHSTGMASRDPDPNAPAPIDETIMAECIAVNASEIWLYDTETGIVYSKLTPHTPVIPPTQQP